MNYPCCDNLECGLCHGSGIYVGPNTIKVFHNPADNKSLEWVEIEGGRPVHVSKLYERTKALLLKGDCATCSPVVLTIVGRLVREGMFPHPRIQVIEENGDKHTICLDTRGDMIQPWPEVGFDSTIDAEFYHRYCLPK